MRKLVGLATAALMLGAVGCNKGYSDEDFRATLRSTGVSDENAPCVEKGMKDKNISHEMYRDNRSDPAVQEIIKGCVLTPSNLAQSGSSVPSSTTP